MTFQPVNSLLWFIAIPSESNFPQSMHYALLASVWPNKYPPLVSTLSTEADVHGAQKVLKQWLQNGKLLLLSHKMPWCALLTADKNYNKSLEKLQDFFLQHRDQDQLKTKCSRPRPRLHDPRPIRLSFLSSRRLDTKTLHGLEDYIAGNYSAYRL